MSKVESLSISGNQFLKMRCDADDILQKLFDNMVKKDSQEGEITIKISVKFNTEFVDAGAGNTARKALKPQFAHKITSAMKYSETTDGKQYDDMKEMIYDEESGKYVSRYIEGAEQMNLFEGELGEQILPGDSLDPAQEKQDKEPEEVKLLKGQTVPQLPFSEGDPEPDDDVIDAEYREAKQDDPEDDSTADESGDDYTDEYEAFNNYDYEDPETGGEVWQ